jgi:streptogramin lyase
MKVVARIRVAGPSDIAAGHEGVWVASYGDGHGSSLVSRIDPSTNEISRRVTIEGDGPLAVATGEGDVWAVSHAPGSEGSTGILSVIDPVGGRVVVSSRFGSGQSVDVAAGLGSAWVMAAGSDTSDRAILRTDDAKKIDLMIRIDDASPVPLYAATAGEGFVWVTGGRGVLWKIDPNKNAVVGDNVMIGDNPPVGSGVVVTGFGSVWVASGDGQIWRLAP